MSDPQDRASRVEAQVHELLDQVRGLDEETLHRAPAEGEWSAIQVLSHVAELVPFWARQAREISERSDDGQLYGRSTYDAEADPTRLEAVEQHKRDTLADMESRLRDALAQALSDLRAIKPNSWSRTARHLDGTVRTAEQAVDELLIHHLDVHIAQLKKTILTH